MKRAARTLAVAGALGSALVAAPAVGAATNAPAAPVIYRQLSPSSPQLARCMPNARVSVAVYLTTDTRGFDSFRIAASGLRRNTPFTVFLLQNAAGPNFGAAEYIGDFTTNANGTAINTFQLIVQEAFSSTIVNGRRVRVDLNRIGAWFADPKGDDFCLGPRSPVTPFDGDNAAGVQAFNSRNAPPLPAP